VTADLPGLGKTLTAITFALIHRQLKVEDYPLLFIVKKAVTRQFASESRRFVDINVSDNLPPQHDGKLRLLDSTGSSYDSRLIPLKYKTKAWNSDLIVLFINN